MSQLVRSPEDRFSRVDAHGGLRGIVGTWDSKFRGPGLGPHA